MRADGALKSVAWVWHGVTSPSWWCRCRVVPPPNERGTHNLAVSAMAVNGEQTQRSGKNLGGWRGSPNSIAALVRDGVYGVPWSMLRKCKHCRRVALRGRDVCSGHAGLRTGLSDRAGRHERRTLEAMDRLGLIPADLMQLPAWRALATVPTATRSPLRLRLVLAWSERERQPLMWADAWRTAIEVGAKASGTGKAWRTA
jgi:hypothetical protein